VFVFIILRVGVMVEFFGFSCSLDRGFHVDLGIEYNKR